MKQKTIKLSLLITLKLGGLLVYGQEKDDYQGRVGINTSNPRATLDISRKDPSTLPEGHVQGAILPHISIIERNDFRNVATGTMIYNTTKNCIDWYDGTKWQCTDGTKIDVNIQPSNKCLNVVYDRCFGKTTLECLGYGASVKEHDFIYCEIKGPDGKRWLNNNLGAEYANAHSPYFSPETQAGGNSTDPNVIKGDRLAYGSLFLFGRSADGHELIDWTTQNPVYPNPTTGMGEGQNPCPHGFRIPRKIDMERLITYTAQYDPASNLWSETQLRLPAAGYVTNDWQFMEQGNQGFYHSNTFSGENLSPLVLNNSGDSVEEILNSNQRYSIRCIRTE